jgi:pSer/pThr/pTyr-binding forkhead associated (FHA) protein
LDFAPQQETFILEIDKRVLSLPINGSLILGRKSASGSLNLFDLSSFNAQELGVSRNHARLQRDTNNTLQITDLGSSNGTYINNERIQPHTPYKIYHGDEIRLANLSIQIRTR